MTTPKDEFADMTPAELRRFARESDLLIADLCAQLAKQKRQAARPRARAMRKPRGAPR